MIWTIGSYEANTANETMRPLVYPDDFLRHPLADGVDRWQAYLGAAKTTGRDHWAMLSLDGDRVPGHQCDYERRICPPSYSYTYSYTQISPFSCGQPL